MPNEFEAWSKNLTLAVVEKDINSLEFLCNNIPSMDDLSLQDLQVAQGLIKNAIGLLKEEAKGVKQQMDIIKAQKVYQENTL